MNILISLFFLFSSSNPSPTVLVPFLFVLVAGLDLPFPLSLLGRWTTDDFGRIKDLMSVYLPPSPMIPSIVLYVFMYVWDEIKSLFVLVEEHVERKKHNVEWNVGGGVVWCGSELIPQT